MILKALQGEGRLARVGRALCRRPDGGALQAAGRRRKPCYRRSIVRRDIGEIAESRSASRRGAEPQAITRETAEAVARAARRESGASHALAVLIDLDTGPDRIDFGGTICIGIATESHVESRRSRILGGREWVRLGAVELGLDCLRRYLYGLPVSERIDFERS